MEATMEAHEAVNYRNYRDSDLIACRNLWEQLTITHRTIYENPGIGGNDPGKYFDEHLKKVGEKNLWIAEAGGMAIGLMGLEIEEEEVTIEPLIIHESWRGRGIGRRFMEIAVREAKGLNATYLNVRPVARNLDALKFFSDNGMINMGHVELFMDLKGRTWKEGIMLHDISLKF